MVPKIIHQIFGPQTNKIIDFCLNSWDSILEQGYERIIWNDQSIEKFVNDRFPFAYKALVNARNHAEAADIARYLIVYFYGGYYMDWDIQVINEKDLIHLFNNCKDGFLVVDPPNGTLASECFSAIKGEKYLYSLTNDILELYNSGKRENIKTPQYSGPYRMRDSLAIHKNSSQIILPFKEVFLYDYSEIFRMPERELKSPLIHYWLHTWI